MATFTKSTLAFLCLAVMSFQIFASSPYSEGIQEFDKIVVSVNNRTHYPKNYTVYLYHSHSNTTVLQFKMRACNGKVLLRAASSQENLFNETYDLPVLFQGFHTDQLLFVQRRDLDKIYLSLELIEGYKYNSFEESVVSIEMNALELEDVQNLTFTRYTPSRSGRIDFDKAGTRYFNAEFSSPRPAGSFVPTGNFELNSSDYEPLTAATDISLFAASDPVYAEIGMKCGREAISYAQYDVKYLTERTHTITKYVMCRERDNEEVCTSQIYANEPSQYFYVALGAEMNYNLVGKMNLMYGVVAVKMDEIRFLEYNSANKTTLSLCAIISLLLAVLFV